MPVEEKNLIIAASLLGVVLVILVGILFYVFYSIKKRMYLRELNAELIHKSELNSTVVKTQRKTLEYIGQELHDNLGQKLTLAMLQVDSINKEDVGKVGEKKKMLNETLQESIKDLRRISRTLNPNFIEDIGFHRGIENEVNRLSQLGCIKAELLVLGTPYRLDTESEMVLFRIFQESINNSLKHSQATNLCIQLQYTEEEFVMKVLDDGLGFDLGKTAKGAGLRNMQSHAAYVDADFSIESSIFKGTSISIVLPI